MICNCNLLLKLIRGNTYTMSFKFTKLLISATILAFTPLFITLISLSPLFAQVFTRKYGDYVKPMIHASNGVCFLTSVEGKFEGDKEAIEMYIQYNQWFLSGGSNYQHTVAGAATCVRWNEFSVNSYSIYGPYKWTQGNEKTYLGDFNQGNGLCFLSRVAGKFRGSGEHIEVTIDPYSGRWTLGGASSQVGVNATAYCIQTAQNDTKLTSEFTWNQGSPTIVLGSDYASCFLTGIKGKFQGSGERVTISSNLNEWYLGGTSSQFGVAASARCYKR